MGQMKAGASQQKRVSRHPEPLEELDSMVSLKTTLLLSKLGMVLRNKALAQFILLLMKGIQQIFPEREKKIIWLEGIFTGTTLLVLGKIASSKKVTLLLTKNCKVTRTELEKEDEPLIPLTDLRGWKAPNMVT